MCACAGFTLVVTTSSTNGSFLLFRTNRLRITLPEVDNQVGKEGPQGERPWNLKNISRGIVWIAVESRQSYILSYILKYDLPLSI